VNYQSLFQGNLAELAGVVALHDATIAFDQATVYGVSSTSDLINTLVKFYVDSIRASQLTGVLAGLPGMRPIKQVVNATMNMFTEPVKAYPRVLHGMRNSAVTSAQVTTVEIFNVMTALTNALQASLEFANG
jgi:hypothetical protein